MLYIARYTVCKLYMCVILSQNSTEIGNVIQILNKNNIEQIVEKYNIKFNDFISEDYIVFYLLLWNKLNHNIDWVQLEKENSFDYYN